MTHPRSAFGASRKTRLAFMPSMPSQAGMEPRHSPSPSRGPSPDEAGLADLPRLARGRAATPGAACKARQRPGEAGSAASAWLHRFWPTTPHVAIA